MKMKTKFTLAFLYAVTVAVLVAHLCVSAFSALKANAAKYRTNQAEMLNR